MRVLVSGGSGFIGLNLVEKLVALGHSVANYDLKASPKIIPEARWIQGDILDSGALVQAYKEVDPDIVFHLAARTDLRGTSDFDYAANTLGTRNVIDAGRTASRSIHTFYASSRLVFAIDHKPAHPFDYKPSTVYGASKIEAENLIRNADHGTSSWTIFRPTSIWGPWFGVPYRNFFDTVRKGIYFNVRGSSPVKSFGYVENSVHQLATLMMLDPALIQGRVLWLSDYPAINLRNWSHIVAREFQVRPPFELPYGTLKGAARIGDGLQAAGFQNPPLTTFRLNNMVTTMVYDTSETSELVGPLPFSLEVATRRTVEWIRHMDKT